MKESFDQHAGAQPRAFDRLAAGGAELRQSEIERRLQQSAHRAGGAFDRARSVHNVNDGCRQRHGANGYRCAGAKCHRAAPIRSAVMAESHVPTSPLIFDRALVRGAAAGGRRRLGPATFLLDRVADDICRSARRGAAPLRSCGRSRHAGRRGAHGARAISARSARVIAAGLVPPMRRTRRLPPTRRRCRSATRRSISSSRRWRCNSSTICRACSCKSAARSNPTACFWRRCSAAKR